MPVKAGILSLNNEMAEMIRNQISSGAERYRTFESIRSDAFHILLIDAEYFEGDESVQFFLSRIRKKLQGIPVILVVSESILGSVNTDWFFDDIIVFPFRGCELSLRIQKLVGKRTVSEDSNLISIGRISINLTDYAVFLGGSKLDFTYKEFELLRLFTQNRGKVFSRKELLTTIWGVEYIGGTRTVDVHIRRLRSKLGDDFNSLIETVRNVGYRCKQ